MLKKYPGSVLVNFSAIFPGEIAFPAKLSETGSALARQLGSINWFWSSGNNAILFREKSRDTIIAVGFNFFLIQTLRLTPWIGHFDKNVSSATLALSTMGVEKVARLSFKSKLYLDLKMSHPEIVDGVFGSYLAPKDQFSDISKSLNDVLVKLYGETDGVSFELSLIPQTLEQATQDFYAWGNIDHFNDPRDRPVPAAEFLSMVSGPVFTVEVELFRTELPTTEVAPFMNNALGIADGLVTRAVNRLLSLPRG